MQTLSVLYFKVLIFAFLFKSMLLHWSSEEADGPVEPHFVVLPR